MENKKGKIIVIGGPTGVGKTSVITKLLESLTNVTRIVTYTTREPREGETDGVDYNFISKDDFKEGIKNQDFLEHTKIEEWDSYYGTKKEDFDRLLQENNFVFFNCDIEGLKAIKKAYPDDFVSIFLTFEDQNEMKQRLLERQPDIKPEDLQNRLSSLAQYMVTIDMYDHTVVNKNNQLENTVELVKKAISA